MSEPDVVLCDIIQKELVLDTDRVVIYDQNWKSPKDQDIYITVATGTSRVVGNVNKYDPDIDEQVQSIILYTTYNVEITSKGEAAKLRWPEVVMAINSDNAEQKMESNNIKIFRTQQMQDLSFIDGSSSLHRYRIPVIINHMIIKRSAVVPYENFQTPEVL